MFLVTWFKSYGDVKRGSGKWVNFVRGGVGTEKFDHQWDYCLVSTCFMVQMCFPIFYRDISHSS